MSQLRSQRSAQHVIKSTVVTEKTTHATERYNCFVFEVASSSNKHDIKLAIEESWGVRVLAVRTQTRIGKCRRHKSLVGVSQQVKRAFVTLHPDDRLNFL